MKKIWIMRKEREAVSPVIATILMVAITVVLAAVLYVMVVGITPPDMRITAGQWSEATPTSWTSGKVVFGEFGGKLRPMNLRVYIKANGSDIGYISWSSDTDPSSVSWKDSPNGASVEYFDYQSSGGEINFGDYLTLSNLVPGTTYTFEAFNVAATKLISMSGDDEFTTPS